MPVSRILDPDTIALCRELARHLRETGELVAVLAAAAADGERQQCAKRAAARVHAAAEALARVVAQLERERQVARFSPAGPPREPRHIADIAPVPPLGRGA